MRPTPLEPRPLDDVVGVLEGSVAGLRAAVPEAHFFDELSGMSRPRWRAAIGVLEKLGSGSAGPRCPILASLTRECSHADRGAEAATAHGRLLRERRDEVQRSCTRGRRSAFRSRPSSISRPSVYASGSRRSSPPPPSRTPTSS